MEWPLDAQADSAPRKSVRRDEPRTKGPGPVEVFTDRPLWRSDLIVTQCRVIEDRIACNMVERCILRNSPPAAADHDGQLCLVVKLVRFRWARDYCPMTDQAGRKPREDLRIFGPLEADLV